MFIDRSCNESTPAARWMRASRSSPAASAAESTTGVLGSFILDAAITISIDLDRFSAPSSDH